MKVRLAVFNNEEGIVPVEIIIGLLVSAFIIVGGLSLFHDELSESFKKASDPPAEENVIKFKSYPPVETKEPKELPKEPPISSQNYEGRPIIEEIIIAGKWHGRYLATSPPMFKGKGGGWEATLYEDSNGNITGNFASDFGIKGQVKGSRTAIGTTWDIDGGDGGLRFRGKIKGGWIDGDFSGTIFQGQQSSGTFDGGRESEIK